MSGHLFIAPGDITQLRADAIAFSASDYLGRDGNLCSSFEANVPGFADWYGALRRSLQIPVPVGSTYWMPLGDGAAARPQGVVVVVSTGNDPRPDKAAAAVRGAVATAAERLRAAGRRDRLLIGLPAFRVGKGGDYRHRLRSARQQLEAAGSVLEEIADVDVAFLTYTPALYRIFLEARREVQGDPAAPRYPELVRALRDGNCVLFVGAGLSSAAGMPGWNELIERLARDLQIAEPGRLDNLDVAQWYREQFGNSRLADVLRSTFGGVGLPTLAHYLLMSLPLRHVITTNYDHLLEQSLTAMKRHPVPVVRQADVAHTGGAAVYVVKLHGDAEQPEDIVLTRDDYSAFFEQRPAMALLLEGLLLNQTFFFVGYSLRDPNFRQLFSRIARMLKEARRPAFATSFEAKGDTAEYLKRQWARQQLDLVPVEGESVAEQQLQFLKFLDRLGEEVTMRAPPLVLAPDVPVSPAMQELRARLEHVGHQVELMCQQDLAGPSRVAVADAMHFLTRHGWRPLGARHGQGLCQLWQRLAAQATERDEKRRLLVSALAAAEAYAEAEYVRRVLQELEDEVEGAG